MTHSDTCDNIQKLYQEQLAEYKKKHPNYCTSCHGWGMHFSTYDPSPAGVSLSSGTMLDVDTCTECVDKNLCPCCMIPTKPVFGHEDNHHVCTECGWSADNEKHTGMHDEPECYCQEIFEMSLTSD
jgi:molybdopterin/thiamine biosynthesis adenylyltransferase